MPDVTAYVEDRQTSEFYPTPEKLVQRMLGKVKWDLVQTILEPSAGKGDIVRGIATAPMRDYHKDRLDVDCIELDPNLRAILKYSFSEEAKREIFDKKSALIKTRASYEKKQWDTGKYTYYDEATRTDKPFPEREQIQLEQYDRQLSGFIKNGIHVVHDDFLTYMPYKHYDLIVMNPPFSCGSRHLLRAIEMQQSGGQIICLLNAETLRNPYTAERKRLASLLEQYDAEIEYIEDAFTDAERRAVVDTALINIQIPFSADEGRSLFDQIARAVFTCPELIDRFNIYAAQQRGWLPPSYGKKQYADMDDAERKVVDSFQGAAAYAKVMQNPAYYLAAPVKAQNLLVMGEGV